LPSFYVRSKSKKNLKIINYKQWLGLWEKAKNKCIPENMPLNTQYQHSKELKKI